jgi:predicted phosphodiesterase
MKLAVISDIHGNLTALDAVLADLETVEAVDKIWVLGDHAAFGPRPAECVQRIRALDEEKTDIIGGNTDRYLVTGERFHLPPVTEEDTFKGLVAARTAVDAMLNWGLARLTWEDYQYLSKMLGKEVNLGAEGYGYVIGYHAIPGSDEAMMKPDTPREQAADYLLDREGRLGIGGHTHLQMDRTLGDWRAVNVGSVGLSFDMPGKAQWGLFTFEKGSVIVDLRAVPYDVDTLEADLKAVEHPAPDWVLSKVRG